MSDHVPAHAIGLGVSSLMLAAWNHGNQRVHRIQTERTYERLAARAARIERKLEELDRLRRVRRALETA